MIVVFSHSKPGGHAENEDAFVICPHAADPACLLCAVADGQGGRAGGACAARVACDTSITAAQQRSTGELQGPATWTTILGAVDQAVADEPRAGFTTLVALSVQNDIVAGASNGDSAAVLLHNTGPATILTSRQRKNPPVGFRVGIHVGFEARLSRPWTILMMSDGVWKYGGWDHILSLAPTTNGEALIRNLRKRAELPRTGGLQDDFTLVVIQDQRE